MIQILCFSAVICQKHVKIEMHDWTQTTLQAKNTVVTYHQVPVFNNSMPNRPLKTKNKHEVNFNPLVLQVNAYRIKCVTVQLIIYVLIPFLC